MLATPIFGFCADAPLGGPRSCDRPAGGGPARSFGRPRSQQRRRRQLDGEGRGDLAPPRAQGRRTRLTRLRAAAPQACSPRQDSPHPRHHDLGGQRGGCRSLARYSTETACGAPFVTDKQDTLREGNTWPNRDQCYGTPWFHALTGFATGGLYFTTLGLATAMPDPDKASEGTTSTPRRYGPTRHCAGCTSPRMVTHRPGHHHCEPAARPRSHQRLRHTEGSLRLTSRLWLHHASAPSAGPAPSCCCEPPFALAS